MNEFVNRACSTEWDTTPITCWSRVTTSSQALG